MTGNTNSLETPQKPVKVQNLIHQQKNKFKSLDSIRIGTLNVRTLKDETNLLELENAFKEKKVSILGLAEIRRKNEKIIQLKSGNILCHSDSTGGQRGVGFLIDKKFKDQIVEFKSISERLAILKVEQKEGYTLTLIQVYAPTSTSSEEESKSFYKTLSEIVTLNEPSKKKYSVSCRGL